MKYFTQKCLAIFLSIIMIIPLSGCTAGSQDNTASITIAYQYGTGYTPFLIMKEQKLIEKYADGIEVKWQVLNSGSAITEGLTAGSIDVAGIGVAPAVTGISKGAPFSIYSGISSQSQGLLTNNPQIHSLSDITSEDKIAVVNIGSIQHILLAMLAEKELGDPHALDNNIVAMSHPDGMQALLSNSVSCHQTSAPYTIQEKNTDGIYLISDMTEVYPVDAPFIVGVTSNAVHDNKPIYDAIVKATKEAIDYANQNKENTAALICKDLGLSQDETLTYLSDDSSLFHDDITGITDIVAFMEKNGFIEQAPSLPELCYKNAEESE